MQTRAGTEHHLANRRRDPGPNVDEPAFRKDTDAIAPPLWCRGGPARRPPGPTPSEVPVEDPRATGLRRHVVMSRHGIDPGSNSDPGCRHRM